ncbi:cadherin-16 [Pristis pectinata]|uniref:cadherin-16 n=1 Tax=Pristis pectinata TaxID=685728 RepID=UPI00223D3351|nr:cadherin-16 [Pristis pectinata]XP_051884386.1 cadherin-16 [Pristis pectinata]XP_051884388.1 cadherin-16 [Pristis pectinata]
MTPIGFLHVKEFNQVAVLLSALSVLSAAKIVTVPENYDGHFPWFLTKIETNSTGNIRLRLADDYNGTFGIEEQAFLFSLRTFDREQRDTYELQVNVTDPGGRQLEGPISITITVMDRNDNAPVFEEDTFLASVHMGAPAGYRILNIVATDLDDPLTPNGDLFYEMISQEPARPSDNMFQVNGLTGDLTLTAEGAATLDIGAADQYQLVVQVKDMGKLNKGNYVKADIIVNITENTWVPLSPVSVRENHEGPYPLLLSKVQWNNNQVRYRLESRFPVDEGLFIIDERGSIYLTQPLDRELEAEYKLVISALDYDGELYDEPLELKVTVTDENDNTPVCSPEIYVAMVQEHEKKGTCVAKLRGEDEDDHLTENADLFFQLHKQVPQGPEEPLFTVDSDGVITLARDMIDYHSLTYHLLIHVSDLAGAEGGLSSTCSVIVHVDEWNDHSPVFSQEQYGPISVPEDADIGHEVITFKATDADLYMSEGWFVTYMFESGNEDQMFGIVQDGQSNVGKLILHKALDFETVSEYRLVVTARNSEELEGTDYIPSATTTVSVRVKDVNERPELPQGEYEVNVSWDTRPGSVLLKLEGRDPDVPAKPIRYRLRNESQQWLSVGADSGEVTFLGRRPAGSPQQLDVLVEDGDDPALFVVAHLVIHIEEVWEDAPGPLLEYSGDFLCTPRREEQVIAITVSHRTVPMTLSVDGQPLEQRKWKIHQRNDTLAFLSIGLSWVEPGVYQVVIALSKKGNATVRLRETLPVHICTCNSQGECRIEVEPIQGKPTILSAVSTTAGTLAVIGLSIIVALVHLSITRKQRKKRQRDVSIEATPLRPSA